MQKRFALRPLFGLTGLFALGAMVVRWLPVEFHTDPAFLVLFVILGSALVATMLYLRGIR